MNKYIKFGMLFLSIAFVNAQDFQGRAIYESKSNIKEIDVNSQLNKNIEPERKKKMMEAMKKMFEKTFILHFDKTSSIYEEEEKLEQPQQPGTGFRMKMIGGFIASGGKHYKNLKAQTYTVDREMMGKEFLIQDQLPKIEWKTTQETKEIGGYICFKATAKQPANPLDYKNFRLRKRKENNENRGNEINSNNSQQTLDENEQPKEIEITAWYTPDIPISNGPENYQGLPGLILEVNQGNITILCSKIILNVKDKKEIKAPTKGKQVSQKEYDEIMKKKMEEMKEMYQSRRGNGGAEIRMGGN